MEVYGRTLSSSVLVFALYLDESAHREDVRGAAALRGRVSVYMLINREALFVEDVCICKADRSTHAIFVFVWSSITVV